MESYENVTTRGCAFTGGTVVATTLVDPRGKNTTYGFNPAGYTACVTDHPGQQTTVNRESNTNIVTDITDPLGRKTVLGYDGNKNVTSVTRYKDALNPPNPQPTTMPVTVVSRQVWKLVAAILPG